MSFFSSIESIINNHFDFAALIVNNFGIVEVANQNASELLTVQKGIPFFNIFEGENSITAERVFLESKNNDRNVKENITLFGRQFSFDSSNFILQISPFNVEKEIFFFVSLKTVNKKNSFVPRSKIKSFQHEALQNLKQTNVIRVVEKIKSSYPFTLIEKKRFQKEIDALNSTFWIKDSEGKYILVNKQFALSTDLKVSQIEGKTSKSIFDAGVGELFELAAKYLNKSLNGIVLEGISENFKFDNNSPIQIIELPISDAEQNIILTIGFTNEIENKLDENNIDNVFSNIINTLDGSAVVLKKNFNVELFNEVFSKMFNVEKSSGTINLKNVFPSDLFKKIKIQLNDKLLNKSINFNHQLIIGEELTKINVRLSKISEKNSDENKYLLIFRQKEKKISQQTVKEKMYDLIMKTSPEAIFIYETDNLKFIDVNNTALNIYGYSREAFLQMDLTDLYAPEDIQTLLESTNDKQNLNGSYTGPWRHKRKDGSSLLVEISKTEIDYEGKKAHLNVIRDITKEVNGKKELQLFKTSFENSRDLIILTDAEGFITFANEPVNKILGFYDAELENRPFLSLLSDGDRAKVNTNIFHSGTNEINTFDIRLKNSEGEFIAAKIIATPILNFRNEVESFSLILQPKIAEVSSSPDSSTVKEIESKNKLDPTFLSNLFHELLTPINVIIGFVQELVESIEEPSEEQKESADIIKENQKILLQTMNTAVEYSHLEQGNIEMKSDKVVFVDILDALEEDTRKEAATQKTELSYSKISSSLSFVTDKYRFITFITLFVQFALKMTKEKKLLLSAYNYGDNSFVVSLKDNRKGITPALLKNLRELFTADESIIKHTFGISRFSVRLIRKLTNLLAEKREVILKNDNPFEFGLVFPVKLKTVTASRGVDKTKQNDEVSESTESTAVASVETLNAQNSGEQAKVAETTVATAVTVKKSKLKDIDFSQLSCLYVEDQIDSQILFKVQMKELKSMDFVTNFEDAIPLLETKSFNFIVMDINLQGEYNGLDALHIIRKMPVYQDVPVIAVSAYVLPGDRENFITAGFDDFITKPVLQDKLYDCLRKIF